MAFPTNPDIGDTHVEFDTTWTYGTTGWYRTIIGSSNETFYNYSRGGGATPAGTDGDVQINDNGDLGFVSGFRWDPSALSVPGDLNLEGSIDFRGHDGGAYRTGASISAVVDAGVSSDGFPCRLVFSTTAAGASSPTERARITSGGYFKASNDGNYVSTTATFHELKNTANAASLLTRVSNASYTATALTVTATREANSAYSLIGGWSGNFGDREFNLRGDGEAFADGSWTGGGADYAEYFEWSDGNPDEEDRRGIAVVLDGNKIRPAEAGEDSIGVISGNPSVVGDSAWNKWSGKYLRDDYGTYIQEDYEVEDEKGNTVIQQRRKLNPVYDPDVEYTSREERPEWDCVGLMGKLRIRKGQPTGSRWIKMRDISATVEEWLVR